MPAKKSTSKSNKNAKRQPAKKNTAAARKQSGAESRQELVPQIVGVVMMLVSILCAYTLVAADGTGFVGVVRAIQTGLAGKLALIVPCALLWFGLVTSFSAKQEKFPAGKLLLYSAIGLIALGMVEVFFVNGLLATMRQPTYANFLLTAFRSQTGSGLLGAITVWPIYVGLNLRAVGSFVVYVGLLVIVLILGKKISLFEIGRKAADRFENVQEQWDARREEREARREELREEREAQLEAEKAARAQQMVIPKVDTTPRVKRPAPDTQDAFVAKNEPDAPAKPKRSRKVEKIDPPLVDTQGYSEDGKASKKKNFVPAAPFSEEQMPPFDLAEDLSDMQEKEQDLFFEDIPQDNYEQEIYDEEEDFILPSPDDPVQENEEYVPGSRLIEREHVFKKEAAQPLPSYSAEKEMKAPIHTEMLMTDEEIEAQEESEPKPSLFGDRVKRANSAYIDAQKEQSAPDSFEKPAKSTNTSPFGPGIASGAENMPFSRDPIFGVQKPLPYAAPEPPEYNYPPVDLLAQAKPSKARNQEVSDAEKGKKLVEVLLSFGITTRLTGVSHGPTVTRFELAPAPGIKVSRITSLVDDIALGLAAKSVRIEAPIPGKPAVGVEVPNDEVETVPLRDVLESTEAQKHPSRVAAAIGRDNSGRNIICDLAKMPHILIAGATGAGKSVCINCIICSILYRATPEEVRLIMIDPKMVELSVYNDIPHLLVPVVTDPKKAAGALEWVVNEMTQRYKKFAAAGAKDIKGYNLKRPEAEPAMPQIVVIIDELADLMMVAPGDVEDAICRIAQLARAAGIHLVVATQRPSVNVITGVIKANIPSRIAFTVASQVDSRTILDIGGAEKLLMRGDMLYAPSGSNKPQRVQGAWISENEVQAVVQYIRDRHEADYSEDLAEHLERANMSDAEKEEADEQHDELLPQAIEFVIDAGQASISMLQRKMRIGYARAGRLIDEMTKRGFIGEADGAKPREVLITREQFRAMFHE